MTTLPTFACLLLLCLAATAQPPPAPTTVAMVIGGVDENGIIIDSVELFGCGVGNNTEIGPYPVEVYLSAGTYIEVRHFSMFRVA